MVWDIFNAEHKERKQKGKKKEEKLQKRISTKSISLLMKILMKKR